MANLEGQETNTQAPKSSNKATYIILAVVLVVAVVLLWKSQKSWKSQSGDFGKQDQKQSAEEQKPKIPENLILGEEIKRHVALDYPDPSKVNFKQYTTSKTKIELIKYYTEQFSKDGWKINLSKQGSETVYSIIAENKDQGLIVNVILNKFSNGDSILVAVTYREL